MFASDAPQPSLSPAEQAIVKSYGGWIQFLRCFGLKPWDQEDAEEAKRILEAFAEDDDDE
ncbi:hypothetical protein N7520_001539 [Penicillium odoratum]|uniref:uncharacterized protein n=1 Tax=Penicillium odoratum TaxID=1167516 RepID=UPI0025474D42|nr:uncharacterized protein N7520_001539 [Penicillium odoratum]KAJ5778293.1 hypothetical protein N7520_001539 [Penicillium odoratum]